jgi:hypothetical protein
MYQCNSRTSEESNMTGRIKLKTRLKCPHLKAIQYLILKSKFGPKIMATYSLQIYLFIYVHKVKEYKSNV